MFKSQVELFDYVWKNHPDHKCFVTRESLNKYVYGPFALNIFAHILRKSAYPEWRLNPNNIVLVTPKIHDLFDNAVLDKIKKFEEETEVSFRILFELERDLHKQYTNAYETTTIERKIVSRYLDK